MIDQLLPPSSLAAFALLALLLFRRRGRAVAAILLLPLVLLSVPAVSQALLRSLDVPVTVDDGPAPGAIVVLSGDVERSLEGADIGPLTLERERAAAALARRTGLPLLVSGGVVTAPPPVAEMMATSLPADFGIPVRWVESKSLTTWDNARFSVPMLRAAGIERVYLVTHAWHMRRSLLAFRRAGMDGVPAPVRLDPAPRWDLVPRASAWERSYYALHEWLGLLYYSVRG